MIARLSLVIELNVRATEMFDGDLSGHCGSINTLEKPIVFTSVGKETVSLYVLGLWWSGKQTLPYYLSHS